MSSVKAMSPLEVSRLLEEGAARGDLEAVASLYERGAVMASPSGCVTVGRAAILEAWTRHLGQTTTTASAPTVVRCGDIALVSTDGPDLMGQRTHVVRRQPDGSWLRIIDQPEVMANLDAA